MVLTKEMRETKKEEKKMKALKAKEEARKQLKRDDLYREMSLQARVRDEVERTWRQNMLKIKEPDHKRDLLIMFQTFERVLDKKDFYIARILKLMEIADDQSQRSFTSFSEIIDTMINNFLCNFIKKSKENEGNIAELVKSHEENSPALKKTYAAESHLQVILYHQKKIAETLRWTTLGEMLINQDEDNAHYGHILADLCSFIEDSYNAMWDQYKSVYQSYVASTASFVKESRKLRKKESAMADIIAAQGKRLSQNDSNLAKLRNELDSYGSGTKQWAFREKRDRYRGLCSIMRSKMVEGCATDEKQMYCLLHESDKTVQRLEAARKKAEKILRLAGLCRRFETLREKVLPFGSNMPEWLPIINLSRLTLKDETVRSPKGLLTSSKSKQTTQVVNVEPSPEKKNLIIKKNSLVDNALLETCGLTKLWHRVSHAELTKRALYREKTLLQKENKAMLQELMIDRNISKQNCSCKASKID